MRVLMRLAGEAVVVELKNGTVLQGVVVGVDVSMNTHLRQVTLSVKGGNPVKVDSLSVRGSTVRYFILPDSLNLDQLLVEQVKKTQTHAQATGGRGRGGAASGGDSRGRGGRGRGRGRGADRGGGRGRGRGDRGGGRG